MLDLYLNSNQIDSLQALQSGLTIYIEEQGHPKKSVRAQSIVNTKYPSLFKHVYFN